MVKNVKNISDMKAGETFEDGGNRYMVILDPWDDMSEVGECPYKCVCLDDGETIRFGPADFEVD